MRQKSPPFRDNLLRLLQTVFCNRVKLNLVPTHSYPFPPAAIHSTYSHPIQLIIHHSKRYLIPVFYARTCLTYLCSYVSSCFTFPYAYVIHFYALYCLCIYIFCMPLCVLICHCSFLNAYLRCVFQKHTCNISVLFLVPIFLPWFLCSCFAVLSSL